MKSVHETSERVTEDGRTKMRKKPQLATIRPFVGGGPALLAPEANIQLTTVHDCAPCGACVRVLF